MMVGLDLDGEAATAALLEANIEAMTGPTAIVTTVVRELSHRCSRLRVSGRSCDG